MMTARPGALAALALLAAAALAVAAPPPDAQLPFNPAEAAAKGDWAMYRVFDPQNPSERLPPERMVVADVAGQAVTVKDGSGDVYTYQRGDAGKSALAFLHGFFGDARDEQLADLREVTVTPDPLEAGGKRWEGAVRIDATVVSKVSAQDGGGHEGEMKATFKIWVAPAAKVNGIVKADAQVEFAGATHRGVIELQSQGAAGESPTKPTAPTGTAAPK
jgi:hypothetical protein